LSALYHGSLHLIKINLTPEIVPDTDTTTYSMPTIALRPYTRNLLYLASSMLT
jgi:hypothetical protein